MDETLILDGHSYHKQEPSLKNIEEAINLVGNNGEKKESVSAALSILLAGDTSYMAQIKEAKEEEILSVFTKELISQLKKLSISLGYIDAVNTLAARQ